MQLKVFGIGLSKTGTSSLQGALEILGYRAAGANRKPLLRQLRSGYVGDVIAQTGGPDAFVDFPYPLMFRELHQHYGVGANSYLPPGARARFGTTAFVNTHVPVGCSADSALPTVFIAPSGEKGATSRSTRSITTRFGAISRSMMQATSYSRCAGTQAPVGTSFASS